MNDKERSQWVDNDEGLYDMFRHSRQSKTAFVRENRSLIDQVIQRVTTCTSPAHYLKYGRQRMKYKIVPESQIKSNLEHFLDVPPELLLGAAKRDCVEATIPADRRAYIDYALPQSLVDEVCEKVGGYQLPTDFVTDWYTISYKVVPVTEFGKRILPIIENILGRKIS